jgi:hypothetical protein
MPKINAADDIPSASNKPKITTAFEVSNVMRRPQVGAGCRRCRKIKGALRKLCGENAVPARRRQVPNEAHRTVARRSCARRSVTTSAQDERILNRMQVIRREGRLMSKKHKRKPLIEEPVEDEIAEPSAFAAATSKILAAAEAPIAFLSAHRWKAVSVAAVAALALSMVTGLVNIGGFASWLPAGSPEQTEAPVAATRGGATAGAQAAVAEAKPKRISKPVLQTCFTPTENCVKLIVAQINAAQSEILVQANSLSAKPLIKALGRAHQRGVKVRVILDKADERRRDRTGPWLIAQRILPQVDTGVASAHNKIMIIDRDTVITGSFNFTEAAQKKNAENVLLIKGHPEIADAYTKNWQRRLKASRPYYGTMAPVM